MKLDEAPVRVVYLMGAGRSGSTVLDIILGNHPEVVSVGEMTNLPLSAFVARSSASCACGQRGNICPFWDDVRREWIKRTGVDDVKGYLVLKNAFEGFKELWCWLRLLRERRRPSPQFQAYAEHTCALFKAIRTVSGKSIIVDSSKNPARALALTMMHGVDLRLIHLVRDGRGIAWSMKRVFIEDEKVAVQKYTKSRPVWRTAFSWLVINLQSAWVCRQLDRDKSMRVRYEDFVTNPRGALERIGGLIDVDFTSVADVISAGDALEIGHTIAGNRLRLAGRVRLRLDREWTQKLSVKDQGVFWALAGWLMRRYGYKRDS
jgi:hypothetical protein